MTTYNGTTLSNAIRAVYSDEDYSDTERMDAWNDFCSDNNRDDDRIEGIDMLDSYFGGYQPTEMLRLYIRNASGVDLDFDPILFTYEPARNDLRFYNSVKSAVKNTVDVTDLLDWLESSGRWEFHMGDYIDVEDDEEE